MKKLIQNRLHIPDKQKGNCYPTALACLLDKDSPEDVIQIQEHYYLKNGELNRNWYKTLLKWLSDNENVTLKWIDNHLYDDSFYMVTGVSPRNPKVKHVVIYQNGKLYHDPHPDGRGIITEEEFQVLTKLD